MPLHKRQKQITSLADWKQLAPPKSDDQWVTDRSAMEVARAWLHDRGNSLPPEVSRVLEAHPHFGRIRAWSGEPEAKLRFDAFSGEPRNTDIAVIAEDSFGTYVLAVEAKADEPFADTVADTLAMALERKLKNPRSNGIARIEQLAAAILGARLDGEPKSGDLRYQLLTATAGALCEAERRGADRAVLLVHEFITSRTDDKKHRRNAQDLQRFLKRLKPCNMADPASGLLGPFTVPGQPLVRTSVRFYVAKVSIDLRLRPEGA